MNEIFLVLILIIVLNVSLLIVTWLYTKSLQNTVQAQQETINKLINREPVTYKEVNQAPPKLDTDKYVAWGGQVWDRDDLNRE